MGVIKVKYSFEKRMFDAHEFLNVLLTIIQKYADEGFCRYSCEVDNNEITIKSGWSFYKSGCPFKHMGKCKIRVNLKEKIEMKYNPTLYFFSRIVGSLLLPFTLVMWWKLEWDISVILYYAVLPSIFLYLYPLFKFHFFLKKVLEEAVYEYTTLKKDC